MRPSRDEYFLRMARLVSSRATCSRRAVGCVLVDAKGRTLATGYNGPPSGMAHCIEYPCPGADAPSGTGLETCQAVHAEQNALLFCPSIDQIETAYVTTEPCLTCTKLLLNTACRRVVFAEQYPHGSEARALWESMGRTWEQGSG